MGEEGSRRPRLTLIAQQLGSIFWSLAVARLFVHFAVVPFFSVASQRYLESNRFGFNETDADRITSVPNIVTMVACPFLGIVIDRIGKRPLLMTFGIAGFVVMQVVLLVFPECKGCNGIAVVYALVGLSLTLFST